jgi:glycosyltransferase involved in cell wall biosynthesis
MVHVGRHFDLRLITSRHSRFNLSQAPAAIERLPALEDMYDLLPKRLGRYAQSAIGKGIGLDGVFFGLDDALRGVDLVNTAESLFYFSYQAARLKQRLGYRLVVLQHEVYPFQRNHSPLVRHMRRTVHREADMFLARTQRAKDALLLEGVDEERIRVVPHGVDTQMFHPQPPDPSWRERVGGNRPIVLCIGRLEWEKGVFTLLQAAALLKRRRATAARRPAFVLVGAGPERSALERLCRRWQLDDDVRFIANVPFAEVPRLISACDMLVLPSIASRNVSEQFGHVLLQAMACERAVIATDCGPMTEVVGDAARLIPQNDAHSLAEAVQGLLEHDDLRLQLARRGLERARASFGAERVAEQVASLYREALGDSKGSGEPAELPASVTR